MKRPVIMKTAVALLTLLGSASLGPALANPVPSGAPSGPCKVKFSDPTPIGSPYRWISGDDYPSRSLRYEETGRVTVRFFVNALGRVETAEVVESTATPDLDAATIKAVSRRGRFQPATRNCQPVPGEFTTSFNWVLPQ